MPRRLVRKILKSELENRVRVILTVPRPQAGDGLLTDNNWSAVCTCEKHLSSVNNRQQTAIRHNTNSQLAKSTERLRQPKRPSTFGSGDVAETNLRRLLFVLISRHLLTLPAFCRHFSTDCLSRISCKYQTTDDSGRLNLHIKNTKKHKQTEQRKLTPQRIVNFSRRLSLQ